MTRPCLLALLLAATCAVPSFAAEICDFTRQPVHLAYGGWHDGVTLAAGATQVRANGRGGLLVVKSLDLSAAAEEVPALTLRLAAGNAESSLQLRLIDVDGHQGAWDFPLGALPAGQPVTIVAAGGATLGKPAHGQGRLNLKAIRQCHLQGSWLSGGVTAVDVLRLATVPAAATPAAETGDQAIGKSMVVQDFTKDGLPYSYVKWQGHTALKGGVTTIDAPSGQGGALAARKLDVRGHEQDTLALTLRARTGNTLAELKVTLKDSAMHEASWLFDLSRVTVGETARLVARDTASLAMGGDGPFDFGALRELHVIGNWNDGQKVALDLLSLETVPPTAEMEQTRRQAAEGAAQAAVAALPPLHLIEDIKPMARGEQSPRLTGVCLVAPDVLALTIEAGTVTRGAVVDYAPAPGDRIEARDGGQTSILRRGGKEIGEVVGSGERRQVVTFASYHGDVLQTEVADHAESFTLTSADDPAYADATHPTAVHRKSKPTDYLGGASSLPTRHVLFLRLPRPLSEGRTYDIDCGSLNVREPRTRFVNDTRRTRSLAVHTTQIGYRAEDPFKRGYLSIWLGPSTWSGAGGAFSYPAGLKFQLLDDATGAEVFSGPVEMAKRATDIETMFRDGNYNGTDVLRMDFSSFAAPGRYRLHVDGVGCGYPFAIGGETWSHAFRVQMRGFYNQRSGIALGPPYTDFVKPRDHHPDDGVPIFRTRWAQTIWSGVNENIWNELKAQATDERVTNGWGGYMDAGDWNPRRVSHMRATLAQLEIADLFPDFVANLKLNIPQDYKVPDLFNEALFEIDCFRRMQTADGGIGYGLETSGDPLVYGVSWHTKVLPVYEAAPDAGNSWFYAAVAARAARLLRRYDAALAEVYAASAGKAMTWAEADFARQCREKGKSAADLDWSVRDSRNLAALEMLRLTGDKHWHDLFMENTVLKADHPNLFVWGRAVQCDAAFAYAIADPRLTDPTVRARAVQGLEALAKFGIRYADGNAFDIVSLEKGRPMFMGFYSTPWCGRMALRAYHVTGNKAYLALGVRACQFSSGANPDNLVFTTGLGANPVRNALKLDAQSTGQPVPEGITVYGIEDHVNFPSTWSYWILGAIDSVMSPKYQQWPLTESYTDTVFFIAQNEFTTDIWDESTWTWGYLAGRPAGG